MQLLHDCRIKSRTDGIAFHNFLLAPFCTKNTLCHFLKGFMTVSSALESEQFSLS